MFINTAAWGREGEKGREEIAAILHLQVFMLAQVL